MGVLSMRGTLIPKRRSFLWRPCWALVPDTDDVKDTVPSVSTSTCQGPPSSSQTVSFADPSAHSPPRACSVHQAHGCLNTAAAMAAELTCWLGGLVESLLLFHLSRSPAQSHDALEVQSLRSCRPLQNSHVPGPGCPCIFECHSVLYLHHWLKNWACP